MPVEEFGSKRAAKDFRKSSEKIDIIPNVIKRDFDKCYVKEVDLEYSPDNTEILQLVRGILNATEFGFYNFDIKKEHIGIKNGEIKMIDWGDAYYIHSENERFHVCYPPLDEYDFDEDMPEKLLMIQIRNFLGRNI